MLAKLIGAPRNTIDDWSKGSDFRRIIVDSFKYMGEDGLKEFLQELEVAGIFKRFTMEQLIATFIDEFSTIDKLANEYHIPENTLSPKPYLLAQNKQDKNKAMAFLFRMRLPNTKTLVQQAKIIHDNAAIKGVKLEVTVFTDNTDEYIQRKYREINPLTNKPYIPEYVILKNVRKELKLDDKAILI